jgi:hypothetical protein
MSHSTRRNLAVWAESSFFIAVLDTYYNYQNNCEIHPPEMDFCPGLVKNSFSLEISIHAEDAPTPLALVVDLSIPRCPQAASHLPPQWEMTVDVTPNPTMFADHCGPPPQRSTGRAISANCAGHPGQIGEVVGSWRCILWQAEDIVPLCPGDLAPCLLQRPPIWECLAHHSSLQF